MRRWKNSGALHLGTGISSRLSHLVSATNLSAGLSCAVPGGLRRRPRHHEEPRHRDRSCTLRCVVADSQCSSISSSTHLADPNSRTSGQSGRLLHCCTRRHNWSPNGQVPVRSECRCSVGLLSQAIRAHNSSALRAPLAASPERIPFRLCVLVHRRLHGSAPAYLAESLHRTTEVSNHRCLLSADNLSLIIPSTRRSTFGDRAFSVAASRAWNSLPNSIRNIESLQRFCRELKKIAFLIVV